MAGSVAQTRGRISHRPAEQQRLSAFSLSKRCVVSLFMFFFCLWIELVWWCDVMFCVWVVFWWCIFFYLGRVDLQLQLVSVCSRFYVGVLMCSWVSHPSPRKTMLSSFSIILNVHKQNTIVLFALTVRCFTMLCCKICIRRFCYCFFFFRVLGGRVLSYVQTICSLFFAFLRGWGVGGVIIRVLCFYDGRFELLEQLSQHQEAAYERLYRWVQDRCQTLEDETPAADVALQVDNTITVSISPS